LIKLAQPTGELSWLRHAAVKGLQGASVDDIMRDRMLELIWDPDTDMVKGALSILQRCKKSTITPKLIRQIAKLARASTAWREAQNALESLLQELERQPLKAANRAKIN
jgi:hypothetical protein